MTDTSLKFLENRLNQQGLNTRLLLADENEDAPLDVLFVALKPDTQDRERHVEIAYLPSEHTDDQENLLQFFVLLPFETTKDTILDAGRLLLSTNLAIPIGCLTLSEAHNAILFRHVMLVGQDAEENLRQVLETISILEMILNRYCPLVEEVASGHKTLDDIIAEANELDQE